jgi:hypothetical protein
MMRKDFHEVERSKFKKSEKMIRKEVSGGQRSKFKKLKKKNPFLVECFEK